MSRMLRLVAAALVVVTALTGLVVLPVAPVAASSWPVTVGNLSDARPDDIMVHPDNGRVYVCGYDGVGERGLLGLESGGSQFMELPYDPQNPDLCLTAHYHGASTNVDGNTVYGTKQSSYNGDFVAAYDGATELWATQLMGPCGSTNAVGIEGPFLGTDGKLYVTHDHYCSGDRMYLTRLNPANGAVIDTRELWDGWKHDDILRQYKDGFVLRIGVNEFRNYRYDDLENPTVFQPTFPSGESFTGFWDVDPTTGRLYLATDANQSCHSQPTFSSVISYDGQSQVRHDVGAACLYRYTRVYATPGGAVVAGGSPGNSIDEGETKLVRVSDAGVSITTVDDPEANQLYRPNEVRVDMHGNVLIAREYQIKEGSSYYKHVDFLLYSASGSLLSRYTTEGLEREEWYYVEDIFLANGAVHALLTDGKYGFHYRVHKLPFALVGYDYSRGTLLGVQSQPVEPLRYVALGDSFSSGEGVEPYIGGTANPPDNECHRSELAYPRLLSNDPELPIINGGFWACSGAEMAHVDSIPQWTTQPPQLSVIPSDARLVTITIGGNDVGFGATVATCVQQSEADCQSARDDLRANLNSTHTSNLVNLFEKIEAAAHDAVVFVSGYPAIFPPSYGGSVGSCQWGPPIVTPGRHVSENELTDMYGMTLLLNQLIRDAVDEMGSNFRYVDPTGDFAGHEVCTSDPWFHHVVLHLDPSTQRHSFHPSLKGQEAYATAFRRSITQYLN